MRKQIDLLLNDSDNPQHRKIVHWMWRLLVGGIVAVILLFIGLSFTDLPSVAELENPKTNEASVVFAGNGEVLGKYYTENRVPVKYADLPEHLVQALIATEDERYYSHTGIDFRGLVRAVAYMGNKGGASTISQQLAKLLFTGTRSPKFSNAIFQKLREWIIAIRLERKYTKEEIIALYLNRYDFINGAQGIRAAAEIYFGKNISTLTIPESAMLVGMLKNSALFNPKRRPEMVLKRREVVLNQMRKQAYITDESYNTLRQEPLGLNITSQTHADGLAPYFRMILAEQVKQLLQQDEYRKADGTAYDIYRDGLQIHTTINPRMQEIAEEEMIKHMSQLQRTFFRHWKNKDPWTYVHGTETEIPVERRVANLNKDIRASERYQQLRTQYLGDVLTVLNDETGLVFHEDDREVERIIGESEEGGIIGELLRKELIGSALASQYRAVLKSKHFEQLKNKWTALQAEMEKQFNEPVEMTVFAYNDEMRTDTTMTPMDSVKYHRMILQTGIMAIDPGNGQVQAWVGGVNYDWFKYDHVNKNTRRQVGSTFKPFVYATAIDQQRMSPCQQYADVPVTLKPGDGQFYLSKPWTPRNSDGKYTGEILTLKDGLRKSKNTISVQLMKGLSSPEPVRNVADLMGIDKSLVPQSPSICLGAVDLSVQEMTGAYTTFANSGNFREPIYLLRISDRYGRDIFTNVSIERTAIEEEANYVMMDMLQYSAGFVGKVKGPVGGKTGTTNDYADGWFMGVTPNLVVGTWVGGDDRWISFRTLTYGQGAYMAKPFFRSFVAAAQADSTINWDFNKRFIRPPGNLGIEINCDAYSNPNGPEEEDGFEEDGFDEIDNDTDFGL